MKIIFNLFVVLVALFCLIGFLCCGDCEKIIERKGCFYDWQLSFECGKLNGSIIPVVENLTSYWTCSELNYTVPAC